MFFSLLLAIASVALPTAESAPGLERTRRPGSVLTFSEPSGMQDVVPLGRRIFFFHLDVGTRPGAVTRLLLPGISVAQLARAGAWRIDGQDWLAGRAPRRQAF